MTKVFPVVVDLQEHPEGIAKAYGSSLAERDAYIAAKMAASRAEKKPSNVVQIVLDDLESGALTGALLLTLATVGLTSLCEHAAIARISTKLLSVLLDATKPEEAEDA